MNRKSPLLVLVLCLTFSISSFADDAIPLNPASLKQDYGIRLTYGAKRKKDQIIGPVTYEVDKATLPNGLTLDNTGVLSGRPTQAKPDGFQFTVKVLDSDSTEISSTVYKIVVSTDYPVAQVAGANPGVQSVDARIITRVSEGVTTLSGLATPTTSGANGNETKVRVMVDGVAADLKNPSASLTTDSNGFFSVELANPLNAGQAISVQQALSNPAPGVTKVVSSPVTQVVSLTDWGRVRAYFTSGILSSRERESFSKQDLFLSFSLDKTWRRLKNDSAETTGSPVGINTFFESRLTAVPVAVTDNASGGTGTGGSSTNNTAASLDSFLVSRKAALFQMGAYFPVVTARWEYNGAPNGLFIAPLAKVGFETPTEAIQQPATGATAATGVTITPVSNERFYVFSAYGVRLGHYKMASTENQAPELISHLDIFVGRFSNLETTMTLNGTDFRKRLLRAGMEGLLKVPSTPLVIGFSANLRLQGTPSSSGVVKNFAKDDLRFLFGTKFDVGKLVAKIRGF
ncbi:MAG: hypothetical protein JWO13_284 [Acidobacteriales bacterium]|nr:hypothetical protein [Terriglobales bacterium]